MSSESMSLEPGTKLASYEILGLMSAGSMGEVYRAKDTKLGVRSPSKCCPKSSPETKSGADDSGSVEARCQVEAQRRLV